MAPDSTLLSVITGTGVTGVFCILFLLGFIVPKWVVEDLRAERDALRQAVKTEQDRADASIAAAQATRDVLIALQVRSPVIPEVPARSPQRRRHD